MVLLLNFCSFSLFLTWFSCGCLNLTKWPGVVVRHCIGSIGPTKDEIHGIINYIDTRHQSKKCHHLKNWPVCRDFAAGVYQSLYTGDTVSPVGIFDPALWTVSPVPFYLVQLSPSPPFPVSKYSLYRLCVTGSWWEGVNCGVLLETKFCNSLILCILPDSKPTK
jgi:hypothetical protein